MQGSELVTSLFDKYPGPLARYLMMYYIRYAEEGIADRYKDQEMRCPVHLSIGQEAAATGVCTVFRPIDAAYSTHRCHAHYLAKGGDLSRMLLEIYGKADGCVGGRGGSMHLMDTSVGMEASVPIVGSSIPLAVGQALAFTQRGEDRVSAAFFGDGSMEEGVFHESANFAALRKLPVAFVCENNLYSVYTQLKDRQPDRPLSKLAEAHDIRCFFADGNDVEAVATMTEEALAHMRAGNGPVFLEMPTYRWREHCGPAYDDHLGYRPDGELDLWKDQDPIAATRTRLLADSTTAEKHLAELEQQLAAYVDGCFDIARQAPLPPAEDASLHVYAPTPPDDTPSLTSVSGGAERIISFGDAVREALHGAVSSDDSVIIMGEGVDDPSSMWQTAAGISETFGKNRVVEMPVAELGLTGIAVGAAMSGLRPVMNLQRVEFALLAVEQIVNNAAKAYYGSNGQHQAPLVIRMVIGRGWGQGPQHAQSLESMFGHFPGLKVIMPAMPADAKGMIAAAVKDNNPVVCIEHRWLHYATGDVPETHYVTDLDGPKVIHAGDDITVVATSLMSLEALRAAKALKKLGIGVEVIDLRVIRPLNEAPILQSVEKTGRLLTVDTGWMTYGVGSEIVARVTRQAFASLKSAPMQLAIADHPVPSSRGLVPGYYPDSQQIVRGIAQALGRSDNEIAPALSEIETERGDLAVDVPDPAFKGPF